jgi:hydroxyacylglutathione hydrolase/adenylyltransferase/sulfurtransferase
MSTIIPHGSIVGRMLDPDIEVTPERAQAQLDAGEAVVVDVREPYEREAGHIEGSRHIELERLASQAETLPRDRPVIFQCRLGARSAMAARAFRSAGYDAWSLQGGLQLWHERGLPVAGGGEVADH